MIVALLAVLGVDLLVIVILPGVMFGRRRWVSHQPGALKGAIHVVDGEGSGLGSTLVTSAPLPWEGGHQPPPEPARPR